MPYTLINYEKKDKVGRITLNAPPSNWLTIPMMKEILQALIDVKMEKTLKLLVFDHAGEKAFCDGVDVADHTPDKVDEMIDLFHRMFRLMTEIDIPTVAVINGRSLGGGCELMSFCDIVVASDKSRIGQPEIAVGVFPPIAAAWFSRIIGLKKTYELLLTGKMISAAEAERIGLVNVVLPAENFKAEVEKYLASYLDKSRAILVWTKRAIRTAMDLPFAEGLRAAEIAYLDGCMTTDDAKEGIAAFMEKRKPVWKDK